MLGIELLNAFIKMLISELRANLAINQAAPDLIPILSAIHSLLQPVRVITQSVLFITSSGHNFTRPFVRHNESEDCEAKEEHNQQEHYHQVQPKQPRDSTTRANQTGQGDDHQEDAENDDGFVEKLLTFRHPLIRQPDSGPENRNRQNESQNIQDSDQVVTQPKHSEIPRREIREGKTKR